MSLTMSLTKRETGEEVAEINWLRNPFGLCNWAEDNVGEGHGIPATLYYVCNNWPGTDMSPEGRKLFLETINWYNERIQALTEGFFFFTLPNYRQFIEGKLGYMVTQKTTLFELPPHIQGSRYDSQDRLVIPMWQFENSIFHLEGKNSLKYYKFWFKELVNFAELLQDTNLGFYCSN